MGYAQSEPDCVGSVPRARPSLEAETSRQTRMDRASEEPRGRSDAPQTARRAEALAEPTEAARAAGADKPAQPRQRRAAGRTPAARRRARRAVARKRARRAAARKRAARRSRGARRGARRRPSREPRSSAVSRRTRQRPRWAKRSRQTDSCLLGIQSARDPIQRRAQSCSPQRAAGCCSTQARAVEHCQNRRHLGSARRAVQEAVPRMVVGRLVQEAVHPTQAQVVAVAVVERGERRAQAAALLRPMDCRKTDKTCWWAGSTRRTACTRSCEKLPSSSYAALACASLHRGAYPFSCVITQLKGVRCVQKQSPLRR